MMSDLEIVNCNRLAAGDHGMVPAAPFRRLLDVVGQPLFYSELGQFFSEIWGAEHVHVWLFEGTKPKVLSGFSADGSGFAQYLADIYMERGLWHHDTVMSEGSRIDGTAPTLFRLDTRRPSSSELRNFYTGAHMRERLVMCGKERFGNLGVSLVRSGTNSSAPDDLEGRFFLASDVVFQMLAKHVDVCCQNKSFLRAFTSLELIERILSHASENIPLRLAQVCARFLYGLSASSIAVDMNLSLETVLSYRKRIYQRLAITSHRELMLWYLELHADLAEHVGDASATDMKTLY